MSGQRYIDKTGEKKPTPKKRTGQNTQAATLEPGRSKKKKRRLKTGAKVFLTIVFIFVIAVSGALIWGINKYNEMVDEPDEIPIEQISPKAKERINCLIIGSDVSGYNTDVLIFASYDAQENKIKTMSIPRDTRVIINGKYHKINACQAIGGTELLLKTVGELTGAPIHYYVKISIDGFKEIVDKMGGVEFDVPQRMKYSDKYQDLYIDLQPGLQILDGDKAEQLVRFRRYPMGDITRTEVQQAFLQAMISQMVSANNILKLPSLFSEIVKHVNTNFSSGDLTYHSGSAAAFFESGEVESFELPGKLADISKVSYYLHDPRGTLDLFKDDFGGTGESEMEEKYNHAYVYDAKDKATKAPDPTKPPETTAPPTDDPGTETPDPSATTSPPATTNPGTGETSPPTSPPETQTPETGDDNPPDWLFTGMKN